MDLISIQQKLRAFAKERDRDQYYSPKNLSIRHQVIRAWELRDQFSEGLVSPSWNM